MTMPFHWFLLPVTSRILSMAFQTPPLSTPATKTSPQIYHHVISVVVATRNKEDDMLPQPLLQILFILKLTSRVYG